jgi:hypothetical protein
MSDMIIPLASKLVLSGVLLLLAAVFVWQTCRMWFNKSLVLAPFDFLEAGTPAGASGEQFSRTVRAELVQLADLYSAGAVVNQAAVPASGPASVPAMDLPALFDVSFFESIELKAYGVEFGSIFKALRRQLESPNEISGSVTHQGPNYSVFAESRQSGLGAKGVYRWNIQYAKDLPEASRRLACSIFRYLAANEKSKHPDAQLFRAVDDEDFCLFNLALAAYDQYRQRKAALTDTATMELLAQAEKPLASLVNRDDVTFPYVHKLAALVYLEQKKYDLAEEEMSLYLAWLKQVKRDESAAKELLTQIKSKSLQKSLAVSRHRPLRPGTSVGSLADGKTAGMICCFAKASDGTRYVVSAAHALGSAPDARVVQPAVRDGGTQSDIIGERDRTTDTIALVKLNPAITLKKDVPELGSITGFAPKLTDGATVSAYRLDGKRFDGKVISSGNTLQVTIDGKKVRVKDVTVTSIVPTGELGGPVLTADGKLLGMIFGSSGNTTIVLPLEQMLKDLGLELVN